MLSPQKIKSPALVIMEKASEPRSLHEAAHDSSKVQSTEGSALGKSPGGKKGKKGGKGKKDMRSSTIRESPMNAAGLSTFEQQANATFQTTSGAKKSALKKPAAGDSSGKKGKLGLSLGKKSK